MNDDVKTYDDLQQRIKELEYDLSIREQIDKTLLFLSQHGWENPRESFFHSLARFLAETLQMDYVCIDRLQGDLLEAETFAIYFDGKFEDNVSYTLKETPCGNVVGKTICCFPCGVRHLFKNDVILQDILAESYVGTTLFNSKNEPIGLIAVIGRQPIENSYLAETVLKLAAVRAAGELERINAEKALKESEEKLRILNADKDRFFTILAHDLKNPFNSLLGFSDLLIKNFRKYDIDKIEHHLNIIHQTTNKTYNLLEDLLLWTKAQSGKLNIELQKIDFNEICQEINKNFLNQADIKQITINYIETEKIFLFADLNMLKTILRNLISNSIKFTNNNGQINIYTEKNDTNVIITISDNGVGIDMNNQEKIWDFTKSISTNGTADEKGTGFGLLLCKEFVEKHGGKIWVESESDKGSDFKFTLPLYND